MQSRLQPFALEWRSAKAITAWCQVWIVTPMLRTKLAAATFMDKECPPTQVRNSSEHLKIKALKTGNPRRDRKSLIILRLSSLCPSLALILTSANDLGLGTVRLGTVRLEVRRAQE